MRVLAPPAGAQTTALGWGVAPDSMPELLARIDADYHPGKLYITKNGCNYDDVAGADGQFDDVRRRHCCSVPGSVASADSRRSCGRLRRCDFERIDMLNLKGMRFPIDVILVCIRWYVAYPLSYRLLEEIMQERGVSENMLRRRCNFMTVTPCNL